jgi:hypothetical protein
MSTSDLLTTYANASEKEQRFSKAVADALDMSSTYTDERGEVWPLVQCIDHEDRTFVFWLGEHGCFGTIFDRTEIWQVVSVKDGTTASNEVFGTVRDAAVAAQELEEETTLTRHRLT